LNCKLIEEKAIEYLRGKASKLTAEKIEDLVRYNRNAAFELLAKYNAVVLSDIKVEPKIESFLLQLAEMHDMKEPKAFFQGMQAALGCGSFKKEDATIQEIIDRAGGESLFSKIHKIPFNTVQKWYHNKEDLPKWLLNLLNRIT
jgi:hypothetical protein